MRIGHEVAQSLFWSLGKSLGYRPAKTWTRGLPTDGVWLSKTDDGGIGPLPVVAVEVIVTEGVKEMRGSIATLSQVSPALGVIVFHDDEIRRGLIRRGVSEARADHLISNQLAWLKDEVMLASQRIAIWTFDELSSRHRLTVSGSTKLQT